MLIYNALCLPHFVAASLISNLNVKWPTAAQLRPRLVHQTCPLLLANVAATAKATATATGTGTGHDATVAATVAAGTSSVWSTDALQSDSR